MPETLLRTKLFVPPLRPYLVPRPHLIERLNQGLQLGHRLILISAPAGFGKTTLVGEWIVGNERPATYNDLVIQDDMRKGMLYEQGNQGGIAYTSFTLDWLTDGQDSVNRTGDLNPS